MIIFIAGVFSGHILVKKIILSELYCCNMIIFCKLSKIKIVQTSLCKGAFLDGEAVFINLAVNRFSAGCAHAQTDLDVPVGELCTLCTF